MDIGVGLLSDVVSDVIPVSLLYQMLCLNSWIQVVKEEMLEQIKKDILLPTINGMRAEGKPFIGCLFAGGWSVGIECSTSGFSACQVELIESVDMC